MFEKHLRKSGILSKDAGLYLYLKCHASTGAFKHFAGKNQLSDFHIIGGTLVKSGLSSEKVAFRFSQTHV